jgi:hypothetical protein
VLAVLTFALRPLMIFYLAGVACALAIHLVQRVRNARKSNSDGAKGRQPRLVWALVASLAGAVLLAQTARDYLLSGWFQYPLSLFAFDVPWRADDPTSVRTATLGAARDPSRMWEAAAGWDWIPGWVERLPRQWETYEFFGLALVAVGCALVASRVRAPLRPRVLALVIMPSALTALVWFAAGPPTFRFVWGPALTLVTLPVGWILFCLSRVRKTSQTANTRPMQAAIGVFTVVSVVVVGYSLAVRIDTSTMTEDRQWRVGPVAVGYRVTPIIQSPVSEGQTVSGLKVLMPRETDQCWDEFPMCSPQVAGSLTGRSHNLQDGLLIRPVAPPA